jgi:hypothetical protein
MFRSSPTKRSQMGPDPVGVLMVVRIHKEIGGGHFVVARLVNWFSVHLDMGIRACLFMNEYGGFGSSNIAPSVPWYPFPVPALALSVKRQTRSLLAFAKAAVAIMVFLPSLMARLWEKGFCFMHMTRF